MADRPLTQKQIEKIRQKQIKKVTVYNTCKQAVAIQLQPPRTKDGKKRIDFYVGQQTVSLSPGEAAQFVEDRLIDAQITNLQKRGMIRVKRSDK